MSGPNTPSAVGIDGCRGGWLVARRDGVAVIDRLRLDDHAITAIDMPIGLPVETPRACDSLARRFLGRRSSTVFPAPPRACLGAVDHADASARSRAAIGRGLPVQAFHLLAKIGELDALVDRDREAHVYEAHPECAFVRMNGGQPLAPKKTAAGRDLRTALLSKHFDLPATPRGAARDDLLDAYALLWVAERVARGEHVVFTDGSRDARGLLMRIVS